MERILNNKWLKIGLLAVAGLILAGGLVFAGYWYGINSNFKSQKSKPQLKSQNLTPTLMPLVTSLPTLSLEPTFSPDETTGWKSYKNTKYGYSVKYPQEWRYRETNNLMYLRDYPNLSMQVPPFEGISFEPIKQKWEDYRAFTVEILSNPDEISLVNYFNKYNYGCSDERTGKPIPLGERLLKSERLTIKNNIVYELDAPGCAIIDREALVFSKWILFQYKDKIFKLAFFRGMPEVMQEPTFNLMLSTFKFLD